MSYKAEVFNVMIASPGDVEAERSIVREVIAEWNAVHSSIRKIVLLPVGWESHTSPEMGSEPQSIINNQILNRCDLLVGIFWTRIGTATGEYASGTVEEIEKHMASDRPAMLYFSSQPVVMDTIQPEQYAKLKQFKESCRTRGLYEGFDSLADFRNKFYRQLQLKINEHKIFHETAVSSDKQPLTLTSTLPDLTYEAKILLREASQDPSGTILHVRYIGGTDLQTNGKNLMESSERRLVAKWEAALQELASNELVIQRGNKGEVFEVSNAGYELADKLGLK